MVRAGGPDTNFLPSRLPFAGSTSAVDRQRRPAVLG